MGSVNIVTLSKRKNMNKKHEVFANQTYLDPRLDPAFKEFFDSEDALKDFLNGVLELEGDDKIKNLTFTFDKELRFRVPQRKKIILDVFATTGTGRLSCPMQRMNMWTNGPSIAKVQSRGEVQYLFSRKIGIFSLACQTSRSPLRRCPVPWMHGCIC